MDISDKALKDKGWTKITIKDDGSSIAIMIVKAIIVLIAAFAIIVLPYIVAPYILHIQH